MIDENEIEVLTQCFPAHAGVTPAHAGVTPAHAGGWPLRLQVELEIGSELFVTRFMRMADRRGEVVLALERPSGRLLLHRKAHYGDDTYRLLTGGIGREEAIAAAAVRESAEETGLQVEIQRLVAVIDSTLCFGDIRLPFVSYVLHVVEAGGQLSADSHEVAGFREVWPGDLPRIAAQLRAIPGERGYWGRWRAVAHDVVMEYFLMINQQSCIEGLSQTSEVTEDLGGQYEPLSTSEVFRDLGGQYEPLSTSEVFRDLGGLADAI